MSHPTVRGVIVVARSGERGVYQQDSIKYNSSYTDQPPWARCASQRLSSFRLTNSHVQIQAFHINSQLHREYFEPSSVNYIHNIRTDLLDLDQFTLV